MIVPKCLPGSTRYIEKTTRDKGRGDQEIYSQAVVGLGDIVESRDSGFVLGLHTEVPVVGHKLQDNSNSG